MQANYSLVAATVMAPNSHNWRMCDSRGRCRGIIEKVTALARPTRIAACAAGLYRSRDLGGIVGPLNHHVRVERSKEHAG